MTKLNQIIAVEKGVKLAEAVKFARETALVGVRVHIPLAAPVMRP